MGKRINSEIVVFDPGQPSDYTAADFVGWPQVLIDCFVEQFGSPVLPKDLENGG
jgi:hypothetical protein